MEIEEHADELRKRLMYMVILICVFTMICFTLSDMIMNYVVSLSSFEIITINPIEIFKTKFNIAVIVGFVMALPFIYIEFYKFVSPALYKKEKKLIKYSIFPVSMFFVGGMIFGYKVVVPVLFNIIAGMYPGSISTTIGLSEYIMFVINVLILCGIMACIPLIFVILDHIGLIKGDSLGKYRKQTYFAAFAASAFVTPPDILSMLLMTLPLVFLFEMSIAMIKIKNYKYCKNSNKLKNFEGEIT